jgi:hypothetical protein
MSYNTAAPQPALTVLFVFDSRANWAHEYHQQYGTIRLERHEPPFLDFQEPKAGIPEPTIHRFEAEDCFVFMRTLKAGPSDDPVTLLRRLQYVMSGLIEFAIHEETPRELYQKLTNGWRPGMARVIEIARSQAA